MNYIISLLCLSDTAKKHPSSLDLNAISAAEKARTAGTSCFLFGGRHPVWAETTTRTGFWTHRFSCLSYFWLRFTQFFRLTSPSEQQKPWTILPLCHLPVYKVQSQLCIWGSAKRTRVCVSEDLRIPVVAGWGIGDIPPPQLFNTGRHGDGNHSNKMLKKLVFIILFNVSFGRVLGEKGGI